MDWVLLIERRADRVTYLSKHGLCVLAEELLELLVADKVKVLGEEATILQLLLAWLQRMQTGE